MGVVFAFISAVFDGYKCFRTYADADMRAEKKACMLFIVSLDRPATSIFTVVFRR